MRFALALTFAISAFLLAGIGSAAAAPGQTLAAIFGLDHTDQPAIGSWQTTVTRDTVVAARDPAWTATVIAMAPSPITTGSIARTEPRPLRPGPRLTGPGHSLDGQASYYWQDQMTATGERFDKRAMTAAHKTLPFGTRVRVTHLTNGRTVDVRINDRGPYIAGRIIDLSKAAAGVIGMTNQGIARVKMEILSR